MEPKASVFSQQATTARTLGRCSEAARAASCTSHAAAGMTLAAVPRFSSPLVKEAARLLRLSESTARSAASCLAQAEADLKAQAQHVPPGAGAAAGADEGAPRSRSAIRRAKKKEKKKLNGAPEVMPCEEGDADMRGGEPAAVAPAAASSAAPGPAPVPAVPAGAGSIPPFRPIGSAVTIQGLASRQELNGQRGHVVALPASAPVGRVAVKVQSGESVLLKCSNIKDFTFLDGTA